MSKESSKCIVGCPASHQIEGRMRPTLELLLPRLRSISRCTQPVVWSSCKTVKFVWILGVRRLKRYSNPRFLSSRLPTSCHCAMTHQISFFHLFPGVSYLSSFFAEKLAKKASKIWVHRLDNLWVMAFNLGPCFQYSIEEYKNSDPGNKQSDFLSYLLIQVFVSDARFLWRGFRLISLIQVFQMQIAQDQFMLDGNFRSGSYSVILANYKSKLTYQPDIVLRLSLLRCKSYLQLWYISRTSLTNSIMNHPFLEWELSRSSVVMCRAWESRTVELAEDLGRRKTLVLNTIWHLWSTCYKQWWNQFLPLCTLTPQVRFTIVSFKEGKLFPVNLDCLSSDAEAIKDV